MGPCPSEKVGVAVDLKGNAISFSNPCLPDGLTAFHFLDPERGMFRVIQKAGYLFIDLLLNILRKSLIILLEE